MVLRELDGHHVSITGPQFAYLSFLSLHPSFGFAHVERRIFNPVKRKHYFNLNTHKKNSNVALN